MFLLKKKRQNMEKKETFFIIHYHRHGGDVAIVVTEEKARGWANGCYGAPCEVYPCVTTSSMKWEDVMKVHYFPEGYLRVDKINEVNILRYADGVMTVALV